MAQDRTLLRATKFLINLLFLDDDSYTKRIVFVIIKIYAFLLAFYIGFQVIV